MTVEEMHVFAALLASEKCGEIYILVYIFKFDRIIEIYIMKCSGD